MTVFFPEELLAEVDRVAQKEHGSRSELIHKALRLYLGARPDQSRLRAKPLLHRAIITQDKLASIAPGTYQDSTTDVKQWRKARG